ncbi:MAG: beta-lactamase family protein, partial [Candidatus Eremiobacteraeota bacterium]|nr:beta-lactamase family protein [Candidatus Eremiobacteraeota bacterium]
MTTQMFAAALALTTAVCGAATAQPEPASASATVLTADTPTKTPSGATFTAPKEWSLRTMAQFVSVQAPEGDMVLAIVDVPMAADANSAAAQAWKLYRPGAHHPVKLVSQLAPHNGWDQSSQIEYETSPNERAAIKAFAHRSGTHWTVLIADGHEGTAAKRVAAIGLVIDSLSAAGYTRENFVGRSAHPLDAARIEELKRFVQTAMRELHVPGISIGLYDRGHVVFEGGFGVRELGKPGRVDANTLYMVGSNTKGMTTLLLARLVDQRKISWDERVTQAYPTFRLGDPATTQQVLVKHLVCACTGLPRKDLQQDLNTNAKTPASATFVQLAATEPTSRFGEVFQYSNPMASAAGYIGGHLLYPDRELGAAYDAAMKTLIFDPLGMSHTTFDMSRALATPDHASPHGLDIHGHVAVATMGPNATIVPYRPAGGAWSSVHDMLRYVEDELTPGKLPNGTRLISAQNVLARRAPTVPLGQDSSYGMG